jgi:hypothetical protein
MGKYDHLYPAPGRIRREWGIGVVDALNELATNMENIKSARFDHAKQLFTLDAIAEQSLFSVKGAGLTVIEFAGDGDGVFTIRVYVDGGIEDAFPTNKAITRAYAFDSSFDIRLFNPLDTSQTASSETIRLRGLVRYTG